jgi:hypothetical protein
MATKMHELIAAEPSVASVFNSMKEETLKTFGKPEAFIKTVTTKTHFADDDKKLDTVDVKELTTTVADRLRYTLEKSFTKYIDLEAQMDATNQVAKADLIVDNVVLIKGLPAATLLQFEKDFKALRELVLAAPTLAPGKDWIVDDQTEGLFRTREPEVRFATRKSTRPVVLYEATKEHPAQVKEVSEDIAVARIESTVYSGMMTSKAKADMLARIDALLIASKKARQRANSVDAVKVSHGKTIVNYILNGGEVSDTDAE